MFGQFSAKSRIFGGFADHSVQNQQHEVGIRQAFARAGDTDLLHFISGLTQTGSIYGAQRNAPQIQRFFNHIARRAGNGRDDGSVCSQQRIEQGRFADIGTACQHDFQTFAGKNAGVRRRQQCFYLSACLHQFGEANVGIQFADIFREIYRGFDLREDAQNDVPYFSHCAAEMPCALAAGQAVRLLGLRGDDVSHSLRLRQVHFVIQKGSLRELAGPGQARAAFQQPRENLPQGNGAAVRGNLDHVFTRIRTRGMKNGQQHVINHVPVRVDNLSAVKRMTGIGRTQFSPGPRADAIRDGKSVRAAETDHADSPRAGRSGKRANRVIILGSHAGIIPGRIEQAFMDKQSRRDFLQTGARMTAALSAALAAPSSLAADAQTLAADAQTFPVSIQIEAGREKEALRPLWRFFGCDEPNYTYMPHGRKLLAELGQLAPNHVYFRTHNLLTTGDGTPALKWGSTNAYTEDAQGHPIYDWTIGDRIFDAGLERGVKPYVQIGFMPEALSVKPEPYRHHWTPHARYEEIYTGWAYPPKDYAKWGELAYQWTKHCVEKYGRAEVELWYWEVWNEPNIPYWQGTPEEYYKLYDYAADGVRRALPTARVGGPEVAGGAGGGFLHNFLEHCARGTNYATGHIGAPLDFISFHAKGDPKFLEAHVRMGIAHQLNDIDAACAVIAAFPEFRNTPIVIGESDPDGCAACQGPQLGYRNGTLYASYTAASFARIHEIADKHGVNMEGALTWAFEFEDQPLFAGFRQLAGGGLDLPVLNVFRMFAKMRGRRLPVASSADAGLEAIQKSGVRAAPDVSALAARDGQTLSVLIWHYHDDDVPGPAADIQLTLRDLPWKDGAVRMTEYRIDDAHSNSFTVWQHLGSPPNPTPAQYAALEKAGQLTRLFPSNSLSIKNDQATVRLSLPRQAVSLFIFERK